MPCNKVWEIFGHAQRPGQFAAGEYPAASASAAVAKNTLFSSLIRFAPAQVIRWYLVPDLEPTYLAVASVSGATDDTIEVSVVVGTRRAGAATI